MTKVRPQPVVIIVPENAQSLDVSGPLDAFLEANRQGAGRCHYAVRLLAAGRDRVVKAGFMSILADGSIHDDAGAIDTLLVAGTPSYAQAYANTDLQAWLRARAPLARRYGSVCTGAFFLGAAGLLDGLSATTHWQHASELAERFPAARIEPDRIYVQDGALWTSAGVTAGIDLALKLIENDHGRELLWPSPAASWSSSSAPEASRSSAPTSPRKSPRRGVSSPSSTGSSTIFPSISR